LSGGHAHGLLVHGRSPVHALAPECKVVALLGFVVAVSITPREALWAFAGLALLIGGLAATAGLRASFMLRRLTIEIPFLLFAALLPFVGEGETYRFLGLTLYADGMWAAWNIVVKATLGLAAAVLVASTTPAADLLRGLQRLRAPKVMIGIAAFMIRYADLVTGEMKRMTVARASRGYDPRWMWQVRAVASSAGTLFVRSYERGERVYLAMVSRGFAGSLPVTDERRASAAEWRSTAFVLTLVSTVTATAWVLA
jgi:cobalt/nickel transport system permease protein